MHIPVLLKETIELLNPQPGETFVDGTFGGGGHTQEIWQKIQPKGRLLAIDWNEQAIKTCQEKFEGVDCVVSNFTQIPEILEKQQYPQIDGLLLDLGFSSNELERSGRGFSFMADEPLLMTYNDQQKPVMEIIAEIDEEELANIIYKYGEERHSRKIAYAIKKQHKKQPIVTSKELAEIVKRAVPQAYRKSRIHPATRTFMALRIYANQELENLELLLDNLYKIMAPQGRIAVISFHSLEDRIVKNSFRQLAKEGLFEEITKKVIKPSEEEIKNNTRARSAKLRGALVK
jgi:16S rRNA (cytosine1402-N4)-methyltransferase